MLPEHRLSTQYVAGYFLPPKDADPNSLESQDWGGIALNDTSEGLRYQLWTARITSGVNYVCNILLSSDNYPETSIYESRHLTDISLTFDQNMNPAYSYMEDGSAKFRWYDSLIEDYTVTTLPVGTTSPRCVLDDKRIYATGDSDILLFYTREGSLYYREQRDRYTVEYLLDGDTVGAVLVAGMSTVNRMQLALGNVDIIALSNILRVDTTGRNRVTTQGYRRKVVGGTYD